MPRPRPSSILIVEDDRTSADVLRSLLSAPDRAVLHADSAVEARRAVEGRSFDLLLLDLILPDADGRDFLLALREDPATAEVPVIICSARPALTTRTDSQSRPHCDRYVEIGTTA